LPSIFVLNVLFREKISEVSLLRNRSFTSFLFLRAIPLLLVTYVLTACGGEEKPATDANSKPVVLTTFTVLADMTQQVAGDAAIVESLTKVGAEIHGYEPTPGDLVRAQRANLILDNGLNLERWADKIYSSVPNVPHVTLTDGLTPMGIVEGPYKDKPNPHAWMSPTNALIYVENIRKALTDLDPPNAATYAANAKTYGEQIKAIDARLRTTLAAVPANQRYIVSCEGAFSYLIRDYQLQELYLWPINADQQGTPQQVAHVVDMVKANKIPVVFCESTVSDRAQQQVASETGARYGGYLYVDSLTGPDGEAPTYLKMLEFNADRLIQGLTGK
jgi:manganese transport system substrate-binding protein